MNVLIVEDSPRLSDLVREAIAERGDNPRQASSVRVVEEILNDFWPDAVLLDAIFPAEPGGAADFNAPKVLSLLEAKAGDAPPVVILMSGDDRAAGHFEIIRDWWYTGRIADMISKNQEGGWNFFKEILLHHVYLHRARAADDVDANSEEDQKWLASNEIVSCEPSMYKLSRTIRRIVSATDNRHTILIVGANGTGKSLIAHAILKEMQAKQGESSLPFFALHCGEIPTNTLHSTLFGHVKGAFTDAKETVVGALEAVGNGVLFLDDIQHLAAEVRSALLSPIQERVFRKMGSKTVTEFKGRLVSSTNIDLEQLHRQEKLPDEFYNRIAGSTIFVPPLSQRPRDVEAIATDLMTKGKRPMTLRPDALRALQSYAWPGNVRQLRALIDKIQINHDSTTVTISSLRSLGIDYLGKPIEWLSTANAAVVSDVALSRFGWDGGWDRLTPAHEEKVLAWLREVAPDKDGLEALVTSLQGRSAPRPIHYYKALLFAYLQGGQISHQAFEETLGLGWDYTNRIVSYLAGVRNGATPGFAQSLLTRTNVRGRYIYTLSQRQAHQAKA
jgi:DNA-binding NtrC family response regulator